MNQAKMMRYVTLGLIILIGFLILTRTTFLTIEPGHNGVLFKRFGGGLKMEKVYGQGFHVVAPWNKMFIYDVRINEDYEEMEVLSKNGLTIKVELSFRFNPIPEKIGYLHDEIGPQYLNRIIKTRDPLGYQGSDRKIPSGRTLLYQEGGHPG